MRDILFRGKRIDNGKWEYGGCVSTENEVFLIYNQTHSIDLEPHTVEKRTVGQYTGLTDKNGKKIFEGDILKIYEGSGDDGYKIRKVYSYGGVLCVDYETSEWDFNALAFLDSDNVFTFEVIGNIHDNPELLEVKE